MTALFIKAFISLFVAIDAVGALPLFTGLTKTQTEQQRRHLVQKSVFAALFVGLVFIFGGKAIFSFLGISENDFRVAGGVLLFVFAIRDLTSSGGHQGSPPPASVGIVPIAVPLIMGPAALATLLLGTEEFGTSITIIALLSNLAIVWLVFSRAGWILKIIGHEASDALAKIFALLLAAIGVMLVRLGVKAMITG